MSDLKPKNTDLVVMTNPLLTSKLDLSELQVKILIEAIALIKPKDDGFNDITIQIKDFAKRHNIKHTNIYKMVEEATRKMIKAVKIKTREDYDSSHISLITRVDYAEKKGIITFKLHDSLAPYLLQIKENQYFKFHIEATRPMSNYHIIRLYWLLIAWQNKNRIDFTIEYIREAIDVKKAEYLQYSDFKKRILEPAKKQFADFGEINFIYDEIRENPYSKRSPVITLRFTISPNPKWKLKMENPGFEIVEPEFETDELRELVADMVKTFGGVEQQAKQFIINHPQATTEAIKDEIINFRQLKKKGKEQIDNYAWLHIAVDKKFGAGLNKAQEQKMKEQKEQLQIDNWKKEFEGRYFNYKKQRAESATNEEIEQFKSLYPKHIKKDGQPIQDFLGHFVGIIRKEISTDDEQVFVNWVKTNKKVGIEFLTGKWRITELLDLI
jgi:hypothetical protein